MKVHLIAIAGGSGSGQTWLAERRLEAQGDPAGGISRDDFSRGLAHLPWAARDEVHFDDPAEVRLARRRGRDQRERGRAAESVRRQFCSHVAPRPNRVVAPPARHADLGVDAGQGRATISEWRALLGRRPSP